MQAKTGQNPKLLNVKRRT